MTATESLIACRLTLKSVRGMIRTYSQWTLNFDIPISLSCSREIWDFKGANTKFLQQAASNVDWEKVLKIKTSKKKLGQSLKLYIIVEYCYQLYSP